MISFLKLWAAALLTAATIFSTAASGAPCERTDAKVAVVNKSTKTLKSILVVHRVGKQGDDVQVRAWADLPPNTNGGEVEISFIATKEGWSVEDFDWWTIFYSIETIVGRNSKQEPVTKQVVYRLEPYNGQGALDNARATLEDAVKTLGPAELKAITAANPANAFLAPLVDPAFKLIAALVSSKGASLQGYKQANLQCRDAGKTTLLTIGNPQNALTASIEIPGGRAERGLVVRSTSIDAEKIRETIDARMKDPLPTKKDDTAGGKKE